MQDSARLKTIKTEVTRQCLIPMSKENEKKILSVTQNKLGNARLPISRVMIWNTRSFLVYKEGKESN